MVMKVVYLNDTGIPYDEAHTYFKTVADWARAHCQSFVDYHIQDVSDVSYQNDFIAQYGFNDPKDALMFELKWRYR
jgi:hypothetical protein